MTRFQAILFIGAIAALVGGWQSVSEYRQLESLRQEQKLADKEMFRLADDIADLRRRIEALEKRL